MIFSPGVPGARTARARTGTVPPVSAPFPAPGGGPRWLTLVHLALGSWGWLLSRTQPYPPCPGHQRARSGLFILPGVMSLLWPGVGAQGSPCSPHLLEHGPKRSRDIIYCTSSTGRSRRRGRLSALPVSRGASLPVLPAPSPAASVPHRQPSRLRRIARGCRR